MAGKRGRLRLTKVDADFAGKAEYEAAMESLQLRMLRIQQAYFHQGRRAVLVFEGMDAAGKGGAIRRLTAMLDPRGVKVWPIGAPTAEEKAQHYLGRFWSRLPTTGTIAIFDRSWYGRVMVERVEGLTPKPDWRRAYSEINDFEHLLTEDGVRILKLFMNISKDEQHRRFVERLTNPFKRWKLTDADLKSRDQWDGYVTAVEDMIERTDTRHAPWHVIPANRKWYARMRVMEIVTKELARGVSLKAPTLDPALLLAEAERLGIDAATLRSA
jgi:PPK2 family polyphosphate:nucleotide phosphotransferase